MKQVFVISLLSILFSISMSAQVKVSESQVDDFKIIKDEELREIFIKNWKSVCRSIKKGKMDLVNETDKTIIFSSAGKNMETYYYAFDKKTMQLTSARYNKFKPISIVNDFNTHLLSTEILSNGDVLYFYDISEKIKPQVTSTIAYAINNGEITKIEATKETYKNMRKHAIASKILISSENEEYFGVLRSNDGETAEATIYNKSFELQYKTAVLLPELPKKSIKSSNPLGNALLGKSLDYDLIISNDGEKLLFYRIDRNKEAKNISLVIQTYDRKTKELKRTTQNFEELDIFVADKGYKTPSFMFNFKNEDIIIAGTSPSKINREGKYKNQNSHFVAYQLSLPDFKVKKSLRVELTDEIYEQLAEVEKKRFDKRGSAVSSMELYYNKEETEVEGVAVRYSTYEVHTKSDGSTYTTAEPAGTIYFPIENGKNSKAPIVQKSDEVTDRQKSFIFSTKDKTYRLQNEGYTTLFYEVNGENEELLYEYKHENNVKLWRNDGFTEDYIIFRTSDGLVKYEFE